MNVNVAVSQFKSIKEDKEANINKALYLAGEASKQKVNILLLQELFQSDYFCSTQDEKFFDYAIEFPNNKLFETFSNFCKSHNMVIPVSFFEKKDRNFFNSLVLINSDGKLSELYRKSHIPEGPGYNEKFTLNLEIQVLRFLKLSLEILAVEYVGINGFQSVLGQ